jgi:hypothetical protein
MSKFVRPPCVEICAFCNNWKQVKDGFGTCAIKKEITDFGHVCDEE